MFYGFSPGKGFSPAFEEFDVKRGYLLDREGEPLILNKEIFKAYLILKGKSLLGRDWPEELRPYIKNPLDLPEKGLYLLSENLSFEEVKKLKKVENVVIKGELERKPLFEGLKPLIGEVSEGKGISGLEKTFDPLLKKGESVFTSLDAKILKRIYYINKNFENFFIEGIALFKLSTGELVGYYSRGEKQWLEKRIFLSQKELIGKIENVRWELGSLEKRENNFLVEMTPLHMIKAFLREACGKPLEPTIIPKKKDLCEPLEREIDAFYLIENSGDWIYFTSKSNLLYVLFGTLSMDKEENSNEKFEKFKSNLQYLVRNL